MTNLKAFWILSIFSIVGLTFMWMSQIQFLANTSSDFTKAQAELSNLRSDTHVEAQGIEVDLLAQNLKFERIDKIHYIDSSLSTALAK